MHLVHLHLSTHTASVEADKFSKLAQASNVVYWLDEDQGD